MPRISISRFNFSKITPRSWTLVMGSGTSHNRTLNSSIVLAYLHNLSKDTNSNLNVYVVTESSQIRDTYFKSASNQIIALHFVKISDIPINQKCIVVIEDDSATTQLFQSYDFQKFIGNLHVQMFICTDNPINMKPNVRKQIDYLILTSKSSHSVELACRYFLKHMDLFEGEDGKKGCTTMIHTAFERSDYLITDFSTFYYMNKEDIENSREAVPDALPVIDTSSSVLVNPPPILTTTSSSHHVVNSPTITLPVVSNPIASTHVDYVEKRTATNVDKHSTNSSTASEIVQQIMQQCSKTRQDVHIHLHFH